MDTRPLGATGFDVTRLGYGSMGLRGPRTWGKRVVNDADAEAILHAVLDAGINFIDTAPDYGVSEERIGRFLGSRRHEFYLATKCGCDPVQHDDYLEIKHTWSPDQVRRNLHTSLARLQTDYIDLMQFHGGDGATLQSSGLLDLMQEFKQQGLIRHFGISSSLPELPSLIDLGVFATFQIPYSCLDLEHEVCIQRAAATGAGIIIRGGIARGGPEAEIRRTEVNDLWEKAELSNFLDDGMTPAQLILRYTLSNPHVDTVIVGTCNLQHLADNVAAQHAGPLPPATYEAIRDRVASVASLH